MDMRTIINESVNKSGLLRKQIADGLGVTESRLSKMLSPAAEAPIDVDHFIKILEMCGTKPLDFIAAQFGLVLVKTSHPFERVFRESITELEGQLATLKTFIQEPTNGNKKSISTDVK